MQEHNKTLVHIFNEMATIYEFLGFENRFRVSAYRRASQAIANLTVDISEHLSNKDLEKIPGIGPSIANKIREFLKTGKIEKFESLKKKVPKDFIELLKVKGLGPETLKKLHQELNINTRSQLIRALKDGSVERLQGFKSKKVENILAGLKLQHSAEKRIVLWEAMILGENLLRYLAGMPDIVKAELAGSIRRRKETIGDLDVLIMAKRKDHVKIMRYFLKWERIKRIILRGSKKASVVIADMNRQVDLRIFSPKEWGAGLLYFTGNKEHNIHLRKLAIEQGWKINEYGLFDIESEKRLAGATEKEMYSALNMSWIPPEIRRDQGEILLAEQHNIPQLVRQENIKGDMHMHSSWSDGSLSIEKLARFVKEHFPYEYIVLTDHSKSLKVAGGLDEDQFREQIKVIKQVNKKLGTNFIKAGAEVDILPDGSLDLSDDLLTELDWVIASIHSVFNRDNTDRLIRACEHPLVSAIGHPTGILIGTRAAYAVDMERVIQAAASSGTVLEINAQPFRMDLNDRYANQARSKGVKLLISTDSHEKHQFDYMKLGVAIARRAWCDKNDIVNTAPWKEVVKLKSSKIQKTQ